MKHKYILLLIFLFITFFQLLVPANMIFQKNKTVESGTLYKFRVKPVDPADPFIGRYVDLSFDQDTVPVDDDKFYRNGSIIYVELARSIDSFAVIKGISLEPYDAQTDYVQAKVAYAYDNKVHIQYPFSKFYMEESKAPDAEMYADKMLRDSTYTGYAEVYIYKGDAVLKDVKINNRTIRSL